LTVSYYIEFVWFSFKIIFVKNMFTGRLNGKRPRRRPRQRWTDRVKTDLTEILEETRIENINDRDRLRGVVEAAKVLNAL
jgi:hypothetical protein